MADAVHLGSGKVRELYALDDERLLLVASDRISTFDVVLPTEIPDKGRVLTGLAAFWFVRTRAITPNHLLAVRPDGRSTECRRLEMLPIECVVRGYLSGSGWKDYTAAGEVCGIRLPAGLRESEQLSRPIFTPATKAQSGHDMNIGEAEAAQLVGRGVLDRVREVTLRLYAEGAAHAASRGIIVADTKFEFGLLPEDGRRAEDRLILIDEVMTPDSSRFWPLEGYKAGGPQPSFDKQFVRDYLERIRWNKQPPVPTLPDDVVARTREKYVEAFERLTGRALQ
jgi:phosphoribosylaminoimidazole-succinocarboxamide synthase